MDINSPVQEQMLIDNASSIEHEKEAEEKVLQFETLRGKDVLNDNELLNKIILVYIELFSEPSKPGEVEWGENLSYDEAKEKLVSQLSRDACKCTIAKTREGEIAGFSTYWSANPRIEGIIHLADTVNEYLKLSEAGPNEQKFQDEIVAMLNKLGFKSRPVTVIEEIGIIKRYRGFESIRLLANEVMKNICDEDFIMWTKEGGNMDILSRILGFKPLGRRSSKVLAKEKKDEGIEVKESPITLIAYIGSVGKVRLFTHNQFTQMAYFLWRSLKADIGEGNTLFSNTRESIRRLSRGNTKK
ncbi:MAG: hypothetical protein Kow0081_4940 [Candidatus Dojkabacteria bacterium]